VKLPTTPARGSIAFGTDVREGTAGYEIVEPQGTFSRKGTLSFYAAFSGPAGSTQIERLIVYVSPGGAETVKERKTLTVSPSNQGIVGDLALTGPIYLDGLEQGSFKLVFVRGGTILAQGTFRVTR
jgi:hypothetical protein